MTPVLQLQNLEVTYHTRSGNLKALHDVSFEVRPGEIVGIVGESGCGKSTVASAVLRLLPPNGDISAGKLLFKNHDLMRYSPEELRQIRGNDISMVFQDPMTSLNPVFSIGNQMVETQRTHNSDNASQKELHHRAIAMLQRADVPNPEERFNHYPHQFSGGLRQRIMIAMALLSQPSLLIADEPTSALDVTTEAQILEMIKELRVSYDTAILFVSHDLGVVAQLCDRVVVMYTGRVVEQGDIFSLYRDPLHPYTRALLASVPSRLQHGKRLATIPGRVPGLSALPPGCKFAERCAFARPACHQAEPEPYIAAERRVRCFAYQPGAGFALGRSAGLAEEPVGLVEKSADRPESVKNSGTLLKLEKLSIHFRTQRSLLDVLRFRPADSVLAVDGVDLDIRPGEVVGLVGESGCGKTTLGKTILGLIPATAGKIYSHGKDTTDFSNAEMHAMRSQIQMIFQDPLSSLSPRLKLSYLLNEPYQIHHTPAEKRYSVPQLLAMVGLSGEQTDKYPHQISGGQARRIGIARALALHPEFLVADEPTSGLDVSVAASIINLMKDLAEKFGLTYLVISHNLNEVGYISDRTAVMYLGNLVEIGPTAELFATPIHPYTMALLSSISEPDPSLRSCGRRLILQGEIPSPKTPPAGCRFHTRCPFVEGACKTDRQFLVAVLPGRQVACRRWQHVRRTGWPSRDSVSHKQFERRA